jgi:hypothetical protein
MPICLSVFCLSPRPFMYPSICFHLSVCLSVCLPPNLYMFSYCLSGLLSVCISIHLPVSCFSLVRVPFCQFVICLSDHLSASTFAHMPMYGPHHHSITPSVCSTVSLTFRVYVLLSPFSFVHLSSIMSVHPSVSSFVHIYSLVKCTYYNMSVLPSACQSFCLSPLTFQCVYYIACLSVFLSICPSSNHVSQSVFLSCLLVC